MKKSIFILLSILFLLISNFTLAQYTPDDSLLVRTTFLRQFDYNIIDNYLESNDSSKVNAALLSMSHSEDTTFVSSILKLNYNKYGENIAFALGQIGESKKSVTFLLNKLIDSTNHNQYSTFDAIGKVGDSITLEYLFQAIDKNQINNSDGFPISISNFNARGITNEKSVKYLTEQLNKVLDENQLFQILFALYRIGPSPDVIPKLEYISTKKHKEINVLYILNNFRKLKYFPNNFELLTSLVTSDSWKIRTETAKTVCYYSYNSSEEADLYLSLLLDANPNVSRTTAIALKNLTFENIQIWLKDKIENLLKNKNLTINTKGELLISYATLYNLNTEKIINDYSELVDSKFMYRLLASDTTNWKFNYNYLSERVEGSNEIELLDLLPSYLGLQNRYLDNKDYVGNLFKILKSSKTSSVSIIADGLEIETIQKYSPALQELILEQINKQKNNSPFAETIVSLANLSNKVDSTFYDSVIQLLSTSDLNSIKKYALDKQDLEFIAPINDAQFNQLWSKAFKYKFAKVETNKGNFTIKFKPEIAPITCGNFISLSEKGFYDGVIFHRVVPDFVIQTGDTTNTGWGGPGYEIVSEFSPLPFDRSAVGIASIGKDTEGSQWFVMHSSFPHLNGRYTNWANVSEGMEIVDIIDEGDSIIKIKLIR